MNENWVLTREYVRDKAGAGRNGNSSLSRIRISFFIPPADRSDTGALVIFITIQHADISLATLKIENRNEITSIENRAEKPQVASRCK